MLLLANKAVVEADLDQLRDAINRELKAYHARQASLPSSPPHQHKSVVAELPRHSVQILSGKASEKNEQGAIELQEETVAAVANWIIAH